MKLEELVKIFRENENLENKEAMEAYMKKLFPFLGIKSIERRELSREYLRENKREIAWEEVFSLWQEAEREFQYIACDYLKERKKLLAADDLELLKKLILKKSWWDTVDNLAPLVGEIVLKIDNGKDIMLVWSKDENIWIRRVAILHQLKFKEKTDTVLLEKIVLNNLGSDEFFINKAIGWIIREYSKTNPNWVLGFFEDYQKQMSNLTIREGSKYI